MRRHRGRFSADRRSHDLPYGVWTDKDGREVLFNRFYRPIWQRRNGIVSAADSAERVAWQTQAWLYDERQLIRHRALCRRLEAILASFLAGEDIRAQAFPAWNGRA